MVISCRITICVAPFLLIRDGVVLRIWLERTYSVQILTVRIYEMLTSRAPIFAGLSSKERISVEHTWPMPSGTTLPA